MQTSSRPVNFSPCCTLSAMETSIRKFAGRFCAQSSGAKPRHRKARTMRAGGGKVMRTAYRRAAGATLALAGIGADCSGINTLDQLIARLSGMNAVGLQFRMAIERVVGIHPVRAG